MIATAALNSDTARDELLAIAESFPVGGWDIEQWPYESHSVLESRDLPSVRRLVETLGTTMIRCGYTVVRLPWLSKESQATQASALTAFTTLVATPLRVFQDHPLWKPLGIDTARPPNRSGGVGLNPFHMDFVNASLPPDFVYLFCVRSDPLGGGASIVAPVVDIELSPEARATLSDPAFRDGRVVRLDGVGDDSNPFAVLSPGDPFPVRYTAKLLDSSKDEVQLGALQQLHEQLTRRATTLKLDVGDLLVVDQRRAVHGREPVGSGQDALPERERRLIMLGFGRSDGPDKKENPRHQP